MPAKGLRNTHVSSGKVLCLPYGSSQRLTSLDVHLVFAYSRQSKSQQRVFSSQMLEPFILQTFIGFPEIRYDCCFILNQLFYYNMQGFFTPVGKRNKKYTFSFTFKTRTFIDNVFDILLQIWSRLLFVELKA